MALEFSGIGLALSRAGFDGVAGRLKVGAPELWAVLTVETRGCGFLPDKRPAILFERHVFHRQTDGRFDRQAPDISDPRAGGYRGGAREYDRLAKAIALDRQAALRSVSWGIGQVMGFNAAAAGFADVETMVRDMAESEDAQLRGMAEFIAHEKLDRPLSARDWKAFARGYNGPDYAKNQYDARLAAMHRRFADGPLPDLDLRAAQVYLTYRGFDPGPVDGVVGRRTRAALADFQAAQALPATGEIDAATLAKLRPA